MARILLGHFIKHKLPISEECYLVSYSKPSLKLGHYQNHKQNVGISFSSPLLAAMLLIGRWGPNYFPKNSLFFLLYFYNSVNLLNNVVK